MSEWGFECDLYDLRILAKKYLDRAGRNERRIKNNFPGREWALNFMKRHKEFISNRFSANITSQRANLNSNTMDTFFDNYKNAIEGISTDCIVNNDETNVTDNPGAKKIIYKRSSKYPERVINATKTSISIMYAGATAGTLLQPYVVYKPKHLWGTWKEGGPQGARYNRSKSGWFNTVCFEDWFLIIIVPYLRNKPGAKAVIGDNLSSHFSKTIVKTCEKLNIRFICLPPNATRLLQPLDVAFYAPLKRYWREILTQ